MYPVVFVKRTRWQNLRKFLSYRLISLAYDISSEGFEDFCCDNGYSFCEDCGGRPW